MPQSNESDVLREMVAACRARTLPARLEAGRARVESDYAALLQLRETDPNARIYGLTTLPGHRDDEQPDADFEERYQHALVESHCVPTREQFPDEVGAFVTYAKAYSVAAGGSLISPQLNRLILSAASDPGFVPAIPRHASYSSGDVIPAAHWTRQLLRRDPGYALKPGEGMAIINGAFVHIGTSVWAIEKAEQVWLKFLANTRDFVSRVPGAAGARTERGAGRTALSARAADFAFEDARAQQGDQRQPPVSVRAIEQTIDAFAGSLGHFADELDAHLMRPSGNPLISQTAAGDYEVRPSGSFVLPSLTISADAVINTLLMTAWHVTRRITYFLSGEVEAVAQDGATADNPLGLIQWPKMAVAKLETMRLKFAGRAFLSGGSTSQGIEDFWSHGVTVADQLAEASAMLSEILVLEHAVMNHHQTPQTADINVAADALERRIREMPAAIRRL
ncbi:aromatic amino acid lyase [Henriciella sp. AS95]|uniref:aromatic amino acid lyase n=1 Tax=Henriciella sp. AS95 TaxID=3135782 RepID=UPI00317DA78B